MYEAGWGKKLSYVFAFSIHGVADVIWRYSGERAATLQRRDQVPEPWLESVLLMINTQLWASRSEADRRDLQRRYAEERLMLWDAETQAASGEASRPLDPQEQTGRQTGDTAWRLARGELGGAAAATPAPAREQVAAATGAAVKANVSSTAQDAAPTPSAVLAATPASTRENTEPTAVSSSTTDVTERTADVAARSARATTAVAATSRTAEAGDASVEASASEENLDENNPFLLLKEPCC